MASCELCGKEGSLVTALVDSAELKVCGICVKYGTIQKQPPAVAAYHRSFVQKPSVPEPAINTHFATILRSARESRNLNQEDFAKLIQEKESLVKNWESGSLKPNLQTAQKLEKILGIHLTLLEEDDQKHIPENNRSQAMTLGDFVKIKKSPKEH